MKKREEKHSSRRFRVRSLVETRRAVFSLSPSFITSNLRGNSYSPVQKINFSKKAVLSGLVNETNKIQIIQINS